MSTVTTQDSGHVRHVILSRAEKRNAMNAELVLDLHEVLREAAGDTDVHCVIVRGDGPVFSAGIDLQDLAGTTGSTGDLRALRSRMLAPFNLCEEMPKPVVCQIHGAAIGAGLELALACDLRVAAEDAVMSLPEVRLGLIPDVGGSSRLPAVVGVGRAKELIMTGRAIDGAEAGRIGLANRVAPAEEVEDAVSSLVDELLACAPVAVGRAKRVIDAAAKPALATTLEAEVSAQEVCVRSEDFAEGARAFVEKRQPEFAGR